MIYLDSCALLKFIKPEAESAALRAWREGLPADTELVTSELASLEITRTLLRAGVDHQQVPYFAGQAVRGIYLVDLTSTVLGRAMAYRTAKLGSLDAVHLASAEPFRSELSEFVTYDKELITAAEELGFPVLVPD
ncbi:type II toxin-antitoxin system VapC family toxin [Kribbella solani]|uniref:type II toxin-antitoxin system VapC family toxin n=1 Tax=Kribbella solani TaxID=236067 RepID=UPI0029BAD0DC|nr:type II toxin-antitoxin system VapC family toxin [Kribbella solani]MDX2970540.1 type II toxin-antitoxin system VapC family toxin [Kribbella solani]MDX3003549.1 type II toxin-antitoxin system VapC family toxin [Kribbella solani]